MYQNYQQFNPYAPQMALANSQLIGRMQSMYPAERQDNIQFVNGRQSAEAYFMPPNSKVILMDQDLPRFYLKETDASGMAKITTYDFHEVEDNSAVVQPNADYLTRKEFEEWKAMYESLISANAESNAASKQHKATSASDF